MAKSFNAANNTANTSVVNNKVVRLEQELTVSKEQAAKLQVLAQESLNRLLFVENKLSPQLTRSPRFWNILFHWKEVMNVLIEIINIIKTFRESLQPKPVDDTNQ